MNLFWPNKEPIGHTNRELAWYAPVKIIRPFFLYYFVLLSTRRILSFQKNKINETIRQLAVSTQHPCQQCFFFRIFSAQHWRWSLQVSTYCIWRTSIIAPRIHHIVAAEHGQQLNWKFGIQKAFAARVRDRFCRLPNAVLRPQIHCPASSAHVLHLTQCGVYVMCTPHSVLVVKQNAINNTIIIAETCFFLYLIPEDANLFVFI